MNWEQSGRRDGERQGRGMGGRRRNSGVSSHVSKKMSHQAGLDNYCHLWDVSVQENQVIMMSGAQCLPPNQHPVTKRVQFPILGSCLGLSHTMGCPPEPFGEPQVLPREV